MSSLLPTTPFCLQFSDLFVGYPLPSFPALPPQVPLASLMGHSYKQPSPSAAPMPPPSQLSLTLTFWCCLLPRGLPSIRLPSRPLEGSPGANESWALGRAQGSTDASSPPVQVPALGPASRWPLPHSILSLTLLRTPPPQHTGAGPWLPGPSAPLRLGTLCCSHLLPSCLGPSASSHLPQTPPSHTEPLPSCSHFSPSSPRVTPTPCSCHPLVFALRISSPPPRPNTGSGPRAP